jgi:trans-aconitate 2-methyltransferase
MSWSSEQYTKFENERNRPVRDLLTNIPTAEAGSAADIGCGPGNSTGLLLARYPTAVITGIDSSVDMIAAARKRLPEVRFDTADIATWQDKGPYDVILANASLQWLPDHATLFPVLIDKLHAKGSLAVQMPDNLGEPAQLLMREIAASGPWAKKLAHADTRTMRADAAWYYNMLRDKVPVLDIWRTTYHHPLMGGATAIVEWFKGSGLRPFLDLLDEYERKSFLAEYEAAIARVYPVYADGSVLLPFPRLFIIATKG